MTQAPIQFQMGITVAAIACTLSPWFISKLLGLPVEVGAVAASAACFCAGLVVAGRFSNLMTMREVWSTLKHRPGHALALGLMPGLVSSRRLHGDPSFWWILAGSLVVLPGSLWPLRAAPPSIKSQIDLRLRVEPVAE